MKKKIFIILIVGILIAFMYGYYLSYKKELTINTPEIISYKLKDFLFNIKTNGLSLH
jgi:hypothetical protein